MKDIFVDANLAKNFANPLSDSYKSMIKWLLEEDGALAVSNKLIGEYNRASGESASKTNIPVIINFLLSKGRLNKIGNAKLNELEFTKAQRRKIQCNHDDEVHLKTVILSYRKLAVSNDVKLRKSINDFPKRNKIKPYAVAKPDDVNYKTYA